MASETEADTGNHKCKEVELFIAQEFGESSRERLEVYPGVLSQKYRYQDEDAPHDHSLPRLTHEVRGPELVHVSEKNLSQIENVHGYVLQSHISPLKTESEFRPNQIHLCSECNTQSVLVPVNWLETDLTICEPSWEVDCAAASPRIPSVGSAMFASIWYAKKLGRRFVHNARKAKSEKRISRICKSSMEMAYVIHNPFLTGFRKLWFWSLIVRISLSPPICLSVLISFIEDVLNAK
ncbi:hypothetical protein MJG53_016641 [Ovis ammon polii x Ovis aries]|uniref:Uncharacterized protein n=1 Tax=Ovis ammon polii x Ovis aries TaxID=2918886 RepID=A0ACB9U997_9CETA|nr:hypothetical protein MJG53_016641 [Ovis ammon polii x Ovis aries]